MEMFGRPTLDESGEQLSVEKGEILCQPCSSSDGDWVIAMGYCLNCNEYFCAACLKLHRKQSVSRCHTMPKSLVPETDVESCSEICAMHTNEIVKFYCSSHDTIGCGDCVVLEHKVCKVERIQDISYSYFRGPEHKQLVETVGQFLLTLEDLGTYIEVARQDMNTINSKALDDMKTFRKEVNIYLDTAGAEIMAEVNNSKEENEKTISELETDNISILNEIKELDQKLKLQSSKANELFVAAKQMKDKMIPIDITIKQMFEKCQTQPYVFDLSPDLKQMVSSKVPLGKQTEQRIQINSQSRLNLVGMKPQFDGEINVKTPEDRSDCYILASALISPSQKVLADYTNKCLKMTDIEQRKITTRHELCSLPADVAVVCRHLIVVTLPDKQKIQFMSITKKNKLFESHDMNVNGKVRKIACRSDKLIIGYTDKIEILKMNGNLVKTIYLKDISFIADIAFSHDSVTFFVSYDTGIFSRTPSSVHKFDFDCNVLATYNAKTLPTVRGLNVAPDGIVLVWNWTRSGDIHIISPACKKIKEILQQNEHVQYPCHVSFCCHTNTLFLSNNERYLVPKLKNVLKIFQMI